MTDLTVPEIPDDQFAALLASSRDYTLVVLRTTARTFDGPSRPIVREHGRRNLALRAAGILPIVCPITDGRDIAGIGLFDRPPDEVRTLMETDPAVAASVLTYEIHSARGFPGDSLPS